MRKYLLFIFLSLISFVGYSQGLTPKENEEGKWGLIAPDGTCTGKGYVYDDIATFGDQGYFKVLYNEKWQLIDEKGNEVPSSAYDRISPLYKGVSRVVLNRKYGVINSKGNVLLKPEYDKIDFQDDIWFIKNSDSKNVSFGIKSYNGDILLNEGIMQSAYPPSEGVVLGLVWNKDN